MSSALKNLNPQQLQMMREAVQAFSPGGAGSQRNRRAIKKLQREVEVVGSQASLKQSTRVATTGNISLSGLQTIDGVATSVGDRVLVWQQSDASENGIYTASSSGWTRASDFDANEDVVLGLFVFVREGNIHAGVLFHLTNTSAVVVGTTPLGFSNDFSISGALDVAGDTTLSTLEVGSPSSRPGVAAFGGRVDVEGDLKAETSEVLTHSGRPDEGVVTKTYHVTTTDGSGTIVTADIAGFSFDNQQVALVELRAQAMRDTGDNTFYRRLDMSYRTTGGATSNATMDSAVTSTGTGSTVTATAFTAGGNAMGISVTGNAGETWEWTITVRYQIGGAL